MTWTQKEILRLVTIRLKTKAGFKTLTQTMWISTIPAQTELCYNAGKCKTVVDKAFSCRGAVFGVLPIFGFFSNLNVTPKTRP